MVSEIRNEDSSCPGIFSRTHHFCYVANSPGSPLPHLLKLTATPIPSPSNAPDVSLDESRINIGDEMDYGYYSVDGNTILQPVAIGQPASRWAALRAYHFCQ